MKEVKLVKEAKVDKEPAAGKDLDKVFKEVERTLENFDRGSEFETAVENFSTQVVMEETTIVDENPTVNIRGRRVSTPLSKQNQIFCSNFSWPKNGKR